MNVVHLRYFVAAAKEESYAAAAKRLYVTPQTLSKAVACLERSLGVELLVRNNRGIKPTPLGREVAARAERVLDAVDELDRFVREEASQRG